MAETSFQNPNGSAAFARHFTLGKRHTGFIVSFPHAIQHAAFSPCQTGEPWHPSCHGGNSAAKSLSLKQPRALRARCGVQGYYPCPRGLSPGNGSAALKPHVSRPLRTWRIARSTAPFPYQTGEPRGLSPSGGNSAVTPHVSRAPCAQSAQSGVQGVTPCFRGRIARC